MDEHDASLLAVPGLRLHGGHAVVTHRLLQAHSRLPARNVHEMFG